MRWMLYARDAVFTGCLLYYCILYALDAACAGCRTRWMPYSVYWMLYYMHRMPYYMHWMLHALDAVLYVLDVYCVYRMPHALGAVCTYWMY